MYEVAIKHQKVINDITNKVCPEMLVGGELPPILCNEEVRSKVELYDDYLHDTYSSKQGKNWSFLYSDNNHLSDDLGGPFLCNCRRSIVC